MAPLSLDGAVRTRIRFLVIFILSVAAVCVYVFVAVRAYGQPNGVLRVVFLDVGQGDAIYIESPTGSEVLIDGGPGRSVLRQLTMQMGFFDRSLDMVLLTHEDKDHVGGLPDVFSRYAIGTFVRTENQGASGAANLIDRMEKEEGAELVYARAEMSFDLGGGVVLEILFPDRDPTGLETNASSIIAKVTYKEHAFLFTGDSPDEIEQFLASRECSALRSDVLKAGHHGSRTSTSEEFLTCVDPSIAVISAGKDNRYGHPHKEVVERLGAYGIDMLSTAELGTITFESDGQNLVQVR